MIVALKMEYTHRELNGRADDKIIVNEIFIERI